jgi:hypothetical protein
MQAVIKKTTYLDDTLSEIYQVQQMWQKSINNYL